MNIRIASKKGILLCVIICIVLIYGLIRVSYTVYRNSKLEIARETLLEYNIIDENDLKEKYVSKENFIVPFMRTIGATDDTSYEAFYCSDYYVAMTGDETLDMKEATDDIRYGYFYVAWGRVGYSVTEKDGRVHPSKIITVSEALDYIYGLFPYETKLKVKFGLIRDNVVMGGYRKLKSEDVVFLLYRLMNEKRYVYVDREKEFDSVYTHDYYYPENAFWWSYEDEYRQYTYLQMHEIWSKGGVVPH